MTCKTSRDKIEIEEKLKETDKKTLWLIRRMSGAIKKNNNKNIVVVIPGDSGYKQLKVIMYF